MATELPPTAAHCWEVESGVFSGDRGTWGRGLTRVAAPGRLDEHGGNDPLFPVFCPECPESLPF